MNSNRVTSVSQVWESAPVTIEHVDRNRCDFRASRIGREAAVDQRGRHHPVASLGSSRSTESKHNSEQTNLSIVVQVVLRPQETRQL
jgi:hypothetical protein